MCDTFVKTRDTDFVVNDETIIFRGFGIGNWLNLEHFMIGLPGSESQIRAAIKKAYGKDKANKFWEKYYQCYISEADFKFLKELNINSVRLSFNYHHFESDDEPYRYKEEGFTELDRVLKLCEQYQIYAILDLHAAPGGQNPDWHSDNAIGEPLFWEYPEFRNRTIALWKELAERYKDNTWIAAYDFLNEPAHFEFQDKAVDTFFKQLVKEIRAIDENHMFFIEGDFYANRFKGFEPFDDPNLAYSFHFYPSWLVHEHDTEEALSKALDNMYQNSDISYVKEVLKKPLWCGETGLSSKRSWKPEANKLAFYKTLELFEQHEISWSIWNYKDARAMSCVRSKENSKWMNFSRLACGSWEFTKEFDKYLRSDGEIKKLYPTVDSEGLRRRLIFRLLANNQLVYIQRYGDILSVIPFEEFLSYPESFLFDKCEIWPVITQVVKKYTEKTI